jgi:hypothetical protein
MRACALGNPGGALVESEDGVAVGVGRAASRRGAVSHPEGRTATPVRCLSDREGAVRARHARTPPPRTRPKRPLRIGDDPPSPWPAEGVVERPGRLYGTVSGWPRIAVTGDSRSPNTSVTSSFAAPPSSRRDAPDDVRQRFEGVQRRGVSSARTDGPAVDETQATSPHRRRPAVPVACGGCRRASGSSLRYGVGMAKDRRYGGLEISQYLRNLIFRRASELA